MATKKDKAAKPVVGVVQRQGTRETDPGHTYELPNLLDKSSQTLQFVKKELAEGKPAGTLEVVNDGTTTEAVLNALVMRLSVLNKILPDSYTTKAIEHLECALGALINRTKDRENRGVEGTNKE